MGGDHGGDRTYVVAGIEIILTAVDLPLGEVLGGQGIALVESRTEAGAAPEGIRGDGRGAACLHRGHDTFTEAIIGVGGGRTGAGVGDRCQPVRPIPGEGVGAIACELAVGIVGERLIILKTAVDFAS